MAENNFTQAGVVETDKNYLVKTMHIIDNQLVVLYENSFYYYRSNSNTLLIESFDISDIKNISKSASVTIDGSINSTRVVDGKLYLISEFSPQVQYTYPKVYFDEKPLCSGYDESQCYYGLYDYQKGKYYRYDYSNPTITFTDLIPTFKDNITPGEKDLITPSKFYAPLKMNQSAYITSVVQLDPKTLGLEDVSSFVGYTDTVYGSLNGIYLVSSVYPYYYDFWNYKSRSAIYKFSISNGIEYKGRGFVDGRVLNQFSLSEKNNILRVATTNGFSWTGGDTNNSVITLEERDGALETVDLLSDFGKEGEEIKSVRFVGDRGFVVTFVTTDPLYTLDLSDPANLKKVGELQITGFSEYFHPIDDNRLLSIGREASVEGIREGLMVELFDISDFSNPQLVDKKIIGDRSYSSEAEYNHKAFVYRESDKTFAFPISAYHYDNQTYSFSYKNFLQSFYLTDMTIQEIGKLSLDKNSSSYYGSSRGVVFTYDGVDYIGYFNGANFVAATISELKGE